MSDNLEKILDVDAANKVAEETKEAEVVKTTKEKKPKKTTKKKTKEQENWFLKILKEEHKWETYFLGFISCFSIGVGALVLSGVLVFNAGTFFATYSQTVGIVFEVVGVIGFLLFIIPIFKPTRREIKHLSLPTRTLFLGNVARVFIFITLLALVFVLYDSVITAVLGFILGKM